MHPDSSPPTGDAGFSDETVALTTHPGEDSVAPIVVPRKVGRVSLVEEIGRGAMGVVWRGRDELLERDVAVKFIIGARPEDHVAGWQTFLRGVRAAAAVQHPGLVAIHQADTVGDTPFIVMELVEGVPLDALLTRRGALLIPQALALAAGIADALIALHTADIVHRDVKPANVILDHNGRVRLTDFGLAVARSSHGGLSDPIPLSGTPAYMAPEMFDGVISPRTDVYALGMTVFELLTGRPPFYGSVFALRELQRTTPLPVRPLQDLGVPPVLIEIIQRATAKNPAFRIKSAVQVLDALHRTAPETNDEQRRADVLSTLLATPAPLSPRSQSHMPNPDGLDAIVEAKRRLRTEEAVTGHHATPIKVTSDCPGTFISDMPCLKCGYSLVGLSVDGRCPECNHSVGAILARAALTFGDVEWAQRRARALRLGAFIALLVFPWSVGAVMSMWPPAIPVLIIQSLYALNAVVAVVMNILIIWHASVLHRDLQPIPYQIRPSDAFLPIAALALISALASFFPAPWTVVFQALCLVAFAWETALDIRRIARNAGVEVLGSPAERLKAWTVFSLVTPLAAFLLAATSTTAGISKLLGAWEYALAALAMTPLIIVAGLLYHLTAAARTLFQRLAVLSSEDRTMSRLPNSPTRAPDGTANGPPTRDVPGSR